MACDFSQYQDFVKDLDSSNSSDVQDAAHLEVVIPTGPDGTNRLHIFTGFAVVGFNAKDDDILRRGIVRIDLDFPITKAGQFVDAATNAALSSVFNNRQDDGEQTTFAVDCVSTLPDPPNTPVQKLILTAALAIQGGGGTTGLSRMAYQANVRLRVSEVQLDSLLLSPKSSPPNFQPSATILSGQPWLGRVVLTGPAQGNGVFVGLASGDSSLASVPPSVPVVGGQVSGDFTAPNTQEFFVSRADHIDVQITASLNAIQKTATLRLLGNPT